MNPQFEKINELLSKNKIFLFMKGTPSEPMCGFSAHVAQILQKLNASFDSYNILTDDAMRQSIKEFSDWPTLPQLYIDKEFIGGCDIVDELYRTGELEKLIK